MAALALLLVEIMEQTAATQHLVLSLLTAVVVAVQAQVALAPALHG
jgi:hypothetical protein